ncbi:cytochrome P450 [Litorivivens lipolytica]|uniref:Cytochrome P450 n=1 Tax=Litorivivens lipolytica TaxID=1524264 RepID=A0A7W4Z6N3_9GAMM|nr:cytochrome P450 [Litorivivens lipolytica]MBB3048468.1 cytochrome P450 [Litorivivens lipolytica]
MQLSDIDIYNPDNYVAAVPHEQFTLLRDEAPVYWHAHPDGGGYWVISRYEDVRAVSRDHATFSAQRGFVMVDELPPEILGMAQGQLLGMDPPNHGPIRRAVIERFTSKMLVQMEPMVREIARDALLAAREKPDCNFVFDAAGNLPTAVICSLMGVPKDMWGQIRHWSDMQTSAGDPDLGASPEETQQISMEMGMYGYQLATERQNSDADDLISLLINVEVDGHKVTAEEFASLFIQITVAGNETTRSMIASGMYELLKRPELYRKLEANPELLPGAVEEMLRWSTPLHYFRRTATCDTELHGQQIKENDRVVMLYSSANFDERVFENPQEFDIERSPNPHLAFGHGIHLCLGANLARLEAKIFFEEFFKLFAGAELTGEPKRIRSNLVNGFKDLPVRLMPR